MSAQYWNQPTRFHGSQTVASFVGGMRSGKLANWGWPLVRLSIYSSGVELGPSLRWLKFWVPYWQVDLSEITASEALGRTRLTAGVRFRTRDGDYRIFWYRLPEEVLEVLERLGVPVDYTRRRYRFLWPSF